MIQRPMIKSYSNEFEPQLQLKKKKDRDVTIKREGKIMYLLKKIENRRL